MIPDFINVSELPGEHAFNPRIVWVGDGWVISWEEDRLPCTEVKMRKLDPRGNPLTPVVSVSGGVDSPAWAMQAAIAWSGTRLLFTWNEEPYDENCAGGGTTDREVLVQIFDDRLNPASEKTRLDCGSAEDIRSEVAWSGRYFGVTWEYEGSDSSILFSAVDREGTAQRRCGVEVDTNDEPTSGSADIAWSGNDFGITWYAIPPAGPDADGSAEIYMRRMSEDGGLLGGVERITNAPQHSVRPDIEWADGEWGLSWADARSNTQTLYEVYLARLDGSGAKIDPPGDVRVTCCNVDGNGTDRYWNALSWTGEEYGLSYVDEVNTFRGRGEVFFQRIDALGQLIGDPLWVSRNALDLSDEVDMAWNGREYALVWDDELPTGSHREIFFARVGCNCVDDDGDSYTTCAGGDCADGNPLIHPGASEVCLDGSDNNCDGAIDCQDESMCAPSAGTTPGEVLEIRFSANGTTLSWTAEALANSYDVMTGSAVDLRNNGDFSSSSCAVWRHPTTVYEIETTPDPGVAHWYLVRGKADTCLLGTWGSALRDVARLTCP